MREEQAVKKIAGEGATEEKRKVTVRTAGKNAMRKNKMKKNLEKWNLVLLGVIAVAIAGATTGVSLLIYHNSGDIYLDRSRPGYLPDETEATSEEKTEDYKFEKTGKMTMEALEEYEEKLGTQVKEMDTEEKPFSAEALSDKTLGI